jgi:hypothetical protein
MRRALVLIALFGTFLAGLGCKQIAGLCDCTNDPADAHLPVPANPYPAIGQPYTGPAPAAPAVTPPPPPAPMTPPMEK